MTAPSTGRAPARPGTGPSRSSDMAAVTAAVRDFTTANGRTPTFAETCDLMGWSAHHARQVLASVTAAAAKRPAPPPSPPSTTPGPAPTPPPPTPIDRPPPPEPSPPAQPGAIPYPAADDTDDPDDDPDVRARRRAWRWLVAHRQVPTQRAVTARVQTETTARTGAARRRARRREQTAHAAAIAATDGPRVRQWIADYHAAHHQGPLWHELAAAMGWTPLAWNTRQHIMTTLATHGYLTYQPDITRSLTPGPDPNPTAPHPSSRRTTPAVQALMSDLPSRARGGSRWLP